MYLMEAIQPGKREPVVREFPTLSEARRAGEKCYGGGMDVVVRGPRGSVSRLVRKRKPSGKRNVEGKPTHKTRWT